MHITLLQRKTQLMYRLCDNNSTR